MTNQIALKLRNTLTGILPPLSMPFDADGNLVKGALKAQVDFMVESGVRGIVVGGSTGEGHTLSSSEFTAAMIEAHEANAGRVPFVVGLIVQSTREATIEHFRAIWEATQVPILIYNVIPWNYLSIDDMLAIMDAVPGVVGMKQSSGDVKSVSDLVLRAKPENLVLTGIDALLYPSFALGAHGAISALTCAVPGVTVKLFNAVQAGDHKTAKDIHFRLNALWNALRHDNLPACVKYIQHRQGLPMFHPRAPMERVTDEQKQKIDAALGPVLELVDVRAKSAA